MEQSLQLKSSSYISSYPKGKCCQIGGSSMFSSTFLYLSFPPYLPPSLMRVMLQWTSCQGHMTSLTAASSSAWLHWSAVSSPSPCPSSARPTQTSGDWQSWSSLRRQSPAVPTPTPPCCTSWSPRMRRIRA